MRIVWTYYIFVTLLLFVIACQESIEPQFKLLTASETGIDFNNLVEENDTINVFHFMNVYTGAGVAVGDINSDGLTDVYFSGNMVSGRLYLNQGDMQFKDITESAGLLNSRWGTGVTMIDINQDGLLDIYVCVSGGSKEALRANLLYINNGDLSFTESAATFGIGDTRQSMQAAFFDYDKDQDLDMYLMVNPAAYEHKVNSSQPRILDGTSISNDRLYRNNGNNAFSDVSNEAGILVEGYGLGVGISDINGDQWPDIYISNDFIGNDILYINQQDGTFKDEFADHIKHSSYAGMGNDIADIDNNGEPDILVLDMRPEDNERQKLIISSTGYDRFQMMLDAGYSAQYSRNTLQINQGNGQFSEVGLMSGISSTDWSWSGLLADYNNDGRKDMYITNGFLRDLGDLDYIHYQGIYDNPLGDRETKKNQKLESIRALPSAKLSNYAYQNTGGFEFKKVSKEWGIDHLSCSNGAAYADLDNDGDLDLLVNNVSQTAFVYENLNNQHLIHNYLKIRLKGRVGNMEGIGTSIRLYSASAEQFYEHYLSRGYESSVDPNIHFGLGSDDIIDRIEITWPDGTFQLIEDVKTNQVIEVQQKNAKVMSLTETKVDQEPLFKNNTKKLKLDYTHVEDDMVDFKLQPIIPHMHSRGGPGIAVSDVNGDGIEDFYVGGASYQKGKLFIAQEDGTYASKEISQDSIYEDMGTLFFDADNDGDSDLYIVSGGSRFKKESEFYQDRLYINDGNGNFSRSVTSLSDGRVSGSVVSAADYDKDGDLDLFVGGRVTPGEYPLATKSFLLENQQNENSSKIKFLDESSHIEGWNKLTMVNAGIWTDVDNDGWVDLIVVGEFMSISVFLNKQGQLEYIDPNTIGLEHSEGWWNSIAGGDFDGDGDIDYIIGNLGHNSKYKASIEEPLSIYARDYDKDGRIDPVMCYYNDGENYIAHTRDEIISQISAMRGRFKTYKEYAETTFEKSFLSSELKDAYVVKAFNFESSYMENNGDGTFTLAPLPTSAQIAPVEGIVINDVNEDGNLDVLMTGNSYSPDVATGRYDGLKGIVLLGHGDGSFESLNYQKSGFLNDLDASGLSLIRNNEGGATILASNNNGPITSFVHSDNQENNRLIEVEPFSQSALIQYKDGHIRKHEFNYGSGYLSQSSRGLLVNESVEKISLIDYKGHIKIVYGQ